MSRRLKTDIPGLDRRISPVDLETGMWPAVFLPECPDPFPLVVEIGFGRGEFLCQLARQAPRVAHLGIDISRKRVLKLARRLARSEIGNIRLICGSGERSVRSYLMAESVQTCWINFSDPWPKKRHRRRRLVQPELVAALATRLIPGGSVYVSTDDVPYAEHIDEVLRGQPTLENLYDPEPWRRDGPGPIPTAYELAWRREGRPLHFWAYRRVYEITERATGEIASRPPQPRAPSAAPPGPRSGVEPSHLPCAS